VPPRASQLILRVSEAEKAKMLPGEGWTTSRRPPLTVRMGLVAETALSARDVSVK
jgi:hypothetical protein